MTLPTKSTITIEIDVPVSGYWVPAEPDIGLAEGYFEDAQAWFPTINLDHVDTAYAAHIQEVLADARQEELDNADVRHDAAVAAQMEHYRENKP